MTLTHTYTKTFTIMHPWAETLPWTCRLPGHEHSPMVGEPCAVADCGELLRENETCYAVVELPREGDSERWVCWRHVRPDDGPVIARTIAPPLDEEPPNAR